MPDARERETYVSGLPAIVPPIKAALKRAGIQRVHTDAFSGTEPTAKGPGATGAVRPIRCRPGPVAYGMGAIASKPMLIFDGPEEWERWLEARGPRAGCGCAPQEELGGARCRQSYALLVALCFGWIDGQSQAVDEDYFVVAFSPRRASAVVADRPGSRGTTHRRGQDATRWLRRDRAAKADGRWDAAYRQKDAEVPDDLQAALDANPAAWPRSSTRSTPRTGSRSCSGSNRSSAPRPGPRKITQFVDMLGARRDDLLSKD